MSSAECLVDACVVMDLSSGCEQSNVDAESFCGAQLARSRESIVVYLGF